MGNEMLKVEEPKMNVKINIYGLGDLCNHVEDVIYFRYALPMNLCLSKRWFFDYLAARIKVNNPKRKVELIIANTDSLCGDDYVAEKSKTLLAAKYKQLKKLENNPIEDDLFGFNREKVDNKIANLKIEIAKLENGVFDYYVPPVYINKSKRWM